MKTVLIFDYGFSGYLLGNEIEENLPVVVKRITAGTQQDLLEKTNWDIIMESEMILTRYVNRVDAIILANPIVSMIAKEYLEIEHPNQLFIGYGWDLPKLVKDTEKALILVPNRIGRTEAYQRLKAKCQSIEINESDGQRWVEVVKSEQRLKDTELGEEIEKVRNGKLIVYNSKLLMMRHRLEERVGWKVEVADFFEPMMETLSQSLGL